MRKKLISLILALTLVISLGTLAAATDNGSITANYTTSEIHALTIADTSVTFSDVSTATAGSEPDNPSDKSSTYSLTTNDSVDNDKITAELDADMENGLTLSINATAPSTGTSSGITDISSTFTGSAASVVTAIGPVNESTINFTLSLGVTAAAGIVDTSKSLTLTLTDA